MLIVVIRLITKSGQLWSCQFGSKIIGWIGGYTIDPAENFSWPENFVEDGNETEYTTLPRHSVIVGLATGGEVCNLDFIGKTYSVGMKEGVLIADGVWLGPDQGQTSPIQFASSQFVSSVSCRANLIILFCAKLLQYSPRRLDDVHSPIIVLPA